MRNLNDKITLGDRVVFDDQNPLDLSRNWRRDHRLHLHRGQDTQGVSSLDVLALLHSDVDDDTRHGRSDASRVGRGLLSRNVLDSCVRVGNDDSSGLSVELEEALPGSLLGVQGTDGQQLDGQGLSLLDGDGHLLVDLGLAEEVSGRDNRQVSVLLNEALELLEHLGVHAVRLDIKVVDVSAVLLSELGLDFGEVERLHAQTGSRVDSLLVPDDLRSQGFGESLVRLSEVSLEELDNGRGEVELGRSVEDVLFGEVVRDHELGKVTDDLRGRSDLDDVSTELVRLDVLLLDLDPLGTKTKLRSLELQVGVLSTGHLVVKDTRIGGSDVGLEGGVEDSDLRPVGVESLDVLVRDTGAETGLLESGNDGSHGGLRGETREVINGHVDNVGTGLGGGEHRSGGDTGSVVGVDVDREVGVSLSDSADQELGSLRLEQTGHVLDTKNVDTLADKLVGQVEVVVEGILGSLGVGNISRVTNGTLDDTTGLLGGVDTELQIVKVVERVENSENVETRLHRLLRELVDRVVRVRGVANSVGTSNKGLKGNVGNELSESSQSVPRVLVEESHGDVEGGTTPALQRVGVLKSVGSLLGNVGHVDGSHSGSQKRLVGVSPGGVHDKTTLVVSNGSSESLGALVDNDVSPSVLAGNGSVDILSLTIGDLRNDGLGSETGLSSLTLDRGSVDGEISKVLQEFLGSVLGSNKLEKLGSVVNERGPGETRLEDRVSKESDEEGNVGLDTSNSELDESSEHLSSGDLEGGSRDGTLDEQRVVVGSDLRSSVSRRSIESNTVTTSRSVDLDFSSVRLEAGGRVLSGQSRLNGESSSVDVLLSQAKLGEGDTGRDLDLGSDNVDTGDLLGDGVLNLDTRVDLDEVVSALLVDQELGSTGVSVFDVSSKSEGIVQNSLSDVLVEVRGRSDFDDLGSAESP